MLNDLKAVLNAQGGEKEFREIYKNTSAEFKTKMEEDIGKKPVSKKDLENLFKGFEAHHVIPANFLRNNETLKQLINESGVSFGYNNLDNLIFIPSENHTEGKQRGHSEYDAMIRAEIESNVSGLVDDGNYDEAWDELKNIIDKVKKKFIKEIIGSRKNAKHV
ncbi:MAG: AHH domain-containing protein [Fluviicola sp.]